MPSIRKLTLESALQDSVERIHHALSSVSLWCFFSNSSTHLRNRRSRSKGGLEVNTVGASFAPLETFLCERQICRFIPLTVNCSSDYFSRAFYGQFFIIKTERTFSCPILITAFVSLNAQWKWGSILDGINVHLATLFQQIDTVLIYSFKHGQTSNFVVFVSFFYLRYCN